VVGVGGKLAYIRAYYCFKGVWAFYVQGDVGIRFDIFYVQGDVGLVFHATKLYRLY